MTNAIRLVGLPEKPSLSRVFDNYVPKLHPRVRRSIKKLQTVAASIMGHWQRLVVAILVVGALFASVGHGFVAVGLLQAISSESEGRWQTTDTTIGRVRTYLEPVASSKTEDWLLSWQSYMLLALLFLGVALFLLRLIRPGRRLPFVILALVSVFGIGIILRAQHQIVSFTTANPTAVTYSVEPLTPRLAYLQQCGDEIPYVFENRTAGMLFRQLRDDGFTLMAELPTNYGHPDLKQLCITYDALRQSHAKSAIVLQLYTHQEDGVLRPYMYSDALDNTAAYGFFVQQKT